MLLQLHLRRAEPSRPAAVCPINPPVWPSADDASRDELTLTQSSSNSADRISNWDPGVEVASLSDPGLRRNSNQDSLAVVVAPDLEAWRRRGHLFMVADGMGAHAAGELASKMSVDLIPLTYQKLLDRPPIISLREAMEDANEKINSRGRANAEFHGMGTTTSVLLFLPEGAVIGHVGDSRVYRLRGTRLEQLSFDHSLVWEMTAGGQIRDYDVPMLIPKNIITRSLGPNAQVQIDLEGPFAYEEGDTYLLCSDGLSGLVQDAEIGAILAALPPDEAARVLVDLANLRGGPDNITVVIARVGAALVARQEHAPPSESSPEAAPPLGTGLVALGAVTIAALLVAAGALVAKERYLQAGVITVLAGIFAATIWQRRKPPVPSETQGQSRLGRAPYTQSNCAEPQPFAEKLTKLAEQLREVAQEEEWPIDTVDFQARVDRASAAQSQHRAAEAVRELALAIRMLMSQARRKASAGS